MRKIFQPLITALLVVGWISTSSAASDVFIISAGPSWTKVQDGEVTQWSVIPPDMARATRVDLLSYVEGGVRTTYYLIRRACSNGRTEWQRVRPGHMLGVGLDCTGNIPSTNVLRLALSKVNDLPSEAAVLLPNS